MADKMQVKFRTHDYPEPFTEALDRIYAERKDRKYAALFELSWVQCANYWTLKQQLEQYCAGRTLGHSFLVSGHRGSGKTLLTHLAIQRVRWAAEENPRGSKIPFLVPIHGPDLLGAEGKEDDSRALFPAVQQIVHALYRAYAEELRCRFCNAVKDRDPELVAHLTVQLNHHPELSELRAIWEMGGVLESGVLPTGKNGQGLNEIVALFTMIQAVQADATDLGIPLGIASESEVKPHAAAGQANVGKTERGSGFVRMRAVRQAIQALAPIVSLVAGFLAVYATNDHVKDPVHKGAILLITTLLVNRFLQRLPSGAEHGIEERNSLPGLTRLLPMLVSRIYESGFAPIFVVDELDKIPNLKSRISPFIRHLKFFITDRALFCFLTDRDFFEYFDSPLRNIPFPEEETFFSDRILVQYKPADLYNYLNWIFELVGSERLHVMQFVLLRCLILFLSRSHPILLKRYLNANRLGDFMLLEEGSMWTVPEYLTGVYYQIAVEAVYQNPTTQIRLRQRPQFSQWILDTLYYPASTWENGLSSFSSAAEDLNLFLRRQVQWQMEKGQCMLSDSDLTFLGARLRDLSAYLSRPVHNGNSLLDYVDQANWESDAPSRIALQLVVCLVMPLTVPAEEMATLAPGHPSKSFWWKFDRLGSTNKGFSDSDGYVTALEGGRLRNVARARYADLLKCESNLQQIWSDFTYLHLSQLLGRPSASWPHLNALPDSELGVFPEGTEARSMAALRGALELEAELLIREDFESIKETCLAAVLCRMSQPQSCGPQQYQPEVPPAVRALVTRYRACGSSDWHSILLQIHQQLKGFAGVAATATA